MQQCAEFLCYFLSACYLALSLWHGMCTWSQMQRWWRPSCTSRCLCRLRSALSSHSSAFFGYPYSVIWCFQRMPGMGARVSNTLDIYAKSGALGCKKWKEPSANQCYAITLRDRMHLMATFDFELFAREEPIPFQLKNRVCSQRSMLCTFLYRSRIPVSMVLSYTTMMV